jgi:hypothetical protein
MFHVGLAAFITLILSISLPKLHIQIGLDPKTPTSWASLLQSAAGLFPVNVIHQVATLSPLNNNVCWKHQPRRQDGLTTTASTLVAMLLILSGVETNPGPNNQFDLLNARAIVYKGPLVQDLIETTQFDILAVCEIIITIVYLPTFQSLIIQNNSN